MIGIALRFKYQIMPPVLRSLEKFLALEKPDKTSIKYLLTKELRHA